MRVLIIEDDKLLGKYIKSACEEQGHATDLTASGQEALLQIRRNASAYDVIILDLVLPDMSGFEIIQTIRDYKMMTPILILSGKNSTSEKVKGLEIGADDYLTKPFELSELLARVKALYRREVYSNLNKLNLKEITLDNSTREILCRGKEIELTNIEFRLLELLINNFNNVVTRSTILEKVWDMHAEEKLISNSINVHIRRLRTKLKSAGCKKTVIKTIKGVGYKLVSL